MAEPTDDVLTQYLEDNQAAYTTAPTYTLRQVYFNLDERGTTAEQDAKQARLMLETDSGLTNPESLGDRISLQHRYVNERENYLAGVFGNEFAESLRGLERGKWQGPILSGYGMHLVYIEEFSPGRPLTLEEAEREVRRDWANDQRIRTIDMLYEKLKQDYTITIESSADEQAAS